MIKKLFILLFLSISIINASKESHERKLLKKEIENFFETKQEKYKYGIQRFLDLSTGYFEEIIRQIRNNEKLQQEHKIIKLKLLERKWLSLQKALKPEEHCNLYILDKMDNLLLSILDYLS